MNSTNLWATSGGQRIFLLPDEALPLGDFELRSVSGKLCHLDEAAVAPFEVSREQALAALPGAIRQSVAARKPSRSGPKAPKPEAMTPEEAATALAKIREAAASPETYDALKNLALGLRKVAADVESLREQTASKGADESC